MTSNDCSFPDYDLTCWYINQRRILELVGFGVLAHQLESIANVYPQDQIRKMAELAVFKDALTQWLQERNLPTLGQVIIKDQVKPDILFTHYTNWFCKGLREVDRAISRGNTVVPPALAYGKLDDLREGWRINCRFHHEHLTSSSSWSELSGQKPLLVMGLITGVTGSRIDAIPYVIANTVPPFERRQSPIGNHWHTKLECHVDSIDSFKAVKEIMPIRSKKELNMLKNVSEQNVKDAFSDIISELRVPKDWGGERSDLFTDRVVLDGKRISTAFAFKGPAQFKPMTMTHLGKNGDQIERLFSEPADLFILQHCHEITPPVRAAMRAHAQQIGRLRLFCLIDGYDTIRLLKAYGKCGFNNSQVWSDG